MKAPSKAFNFFGSKFEKASFYPAPKHSKIVEPFAGAAGYSLNYVEREVVLYDVRHVVVHAWQYLVDATPEEVRELPLIEPGQDVVGLDCSAEAKLLIGWCLNNCEAPCRRLSNWAVEALKGDSLGYWGPSRREAMAELAGLVKHWRVRQLDWTGLLDPAKDGEATWFLDPPYQVNEEKYTTAPIDYERLGEICRSLPGQVIVCEQEGADWLPFEALYEMRGIRGTSSVQVIWTN